MPAWDKSQEAAVTEFCRKYITLMEVLYKDKELNAWCSNYSAYKNNTVHVALEIRKNHISRFYERGLSSERCQSTEDHARYS